MAQTTRKALPYTFEVYLDSACVIEVGFVLRADDTETAYKALEAFFGTRLHSIIQCYEVTQTHKMYCNTYWEIDAIRNMGEKYTGKTY